MTTVQGVWNSQGSIRLNDTTLTLCASLTWNGGPALVIGKVKLDAVLSLPATGCTLMLR